MFDEDGQISYHKEDIKIMWEEILKPTKYTQQIMAVGDAYPDVRSVVVDFYDIDYYNTDFGLYLLHNPDRCIGIGREYISECIPPSRIGHKTPNLRIRNLPRDVNKNIRHLRSDDLGKMVAVEGMVRKVTTIRPRMTHAMYRCERCGAEQLIEQGRSYRNEPLMCTGSDACNKQATRFTIKDRKSKYIDAQILEIQESPEGLRGGAQPERLVGHVEDDLAGMITAGNRITLNGIIRSMEKAERDKSTIFEIYLDVNSIEFDDDAYDDIIITEEDEQRILDMSRDPELFKHIIQSISPGIYGMYEVKEALALQLFGGCRKEMDDGSVMRGDMHILMVGDPGVAKSQLLRYMSELAPRGIYASGKSASAAGLTAAAVKDDFGDGRWTLEAGALVLADKGLACIDELDKMTAQDRSSLHEAMESQRISVAKAGITATLQCRCSMLAAANPKHGRFENTDTISKQIDLPPALLSRFDMIFVLTDIPNEEQDNDITDHILNSHRRGEVRGADLSEPISGVDVDRILDETSSAKPYFDKDILRKYVAYSKGITPVMTEEARDIIKGSYMNIRRRGMGVDESVPITARQLEGYVRISEASARSRLSKTVCKQDAERAVRMMEYYLGRIASPDGGPWDIDRIAASSTKHDRDVNKTIKEIIKLDGIGGVISHNELLKFAMDEGMDADNVEKIIDKLLNAGDIFSPELNHYKLA